MRIIKDPSSFPHSYSVEGVTLDETQAALDFLMDADGTAAALAAGSSMAEIAQVRATLAAVIASRQEPTFH